MNPTQDHAQLCFAHGQKKLARKSSTALPRISSLIIRDISTVVIIEILFAGQRPDESVFVILLDLY